MIIGRIPLRTHIITEKDDIVDVVKKYAGEIAGPGDIIAVAESVVAITQGRAILPETVRPGFLARFLCRFPGKDGSLATPQAMQLAIEETGTPRILLGAAAAALGKIIGRKGDFYRVAGRHLALIDDVAGTMWPFERHIILGPRDPQKIVDRIREATGAEAVIADVNDTRNVDIIAASRGVDRKGLIKDLEDNPFGNDDQQTPIVVLKMAPKNR
ncbi:MAG: coenzyme F420-0:L-glutamate ligase [Peptococcaceae bacterium]|nr:coenzyme F420-0:L-glutamate ligase [Peptococcaceae bacterium]